MICLQQNPRNHCGMEESGESTIGASSQNYERVEAYMSRKVEEIEIDPFADVYGDSGGIWMRDGDKPVNPNAFTSDHW